MELLRARAERVAAPLQDGHQLGRITALVAMLQREKYALPIDAITAVYQDVTVVPVPCVPEFVAGIANVRGRLISVLDLAAILGLESSGHNAQAALVLAEAGDTSVGFRIETVGEVVELQMNEINPVPANMNYEQAGYLVGLFPDGTAVLNMQAILDDPHLVVDESTD
jgi:purine-binding chemotaxis protein CheW